MSEAKEIYYKLKSELEYMGHEGFRGEIDDYVIELEHQNKELIEIIKDVIQNFSGDDDFLIQDYLTYKFKKYI